MDSLLSSKRHPGARQELVLGSVAGLMLQGRSQGVRGEPGCLHAFTLCHFLVTRLTAPPLLLCGWGSTSHRYKAFNCPSNPSDSETGSQSP